MYLFGYIYLDFYLGIYPVVKVHIVPGLSQTASPSENMMPDHELGMLLLPPHDAEILVGLGTTETCLETLAH